MAIPGAVVPRLHDMKEIRVQIIFIVPGGSARCRSKTQNARVSQTTSQYAIQGRIQSDIAEYKPNSKPQSPIRARRHNEFLPGVMFCTIAFTSQLNS